MDREINDLEYLNYSIGQPYNLVVSLRINGSLTADLLRKVINKLQRKHPLLRVRFHLEENKIPRFVSKDVGEIPIIETPLTTNENTRRIFHEQLVTPFDYISINSPLFRVTWLKADEISDIILCSQHSITDGMSMAFLIRDFITYLNNPSKKVAEFQISMKEEDIFTPKIRRRIPRTAFRAKCFLILLKIFHFFVKGRVRKQSHERQIESKYSDLAIYSWQLTKKETKNFLSKCKKEMISVHSAICTAFLPDLKVINTPVDLRNRLNYPIGEAFGLYAGGTVFRMNYRKKQNFWKNAKRFQRKLLWNLRDRKVFGINFLLNKALPIELVKELGRLFTDIVSRSTPFAITNLRSLDKLGITFESNKFSVVSFNAAISNTLDAMTLVVFTLRKQMNFHFHYIKSVQKKSEIEEIAKKATKRILEA